MDEKSALGAEHDEDDDVEEELEVVVVSGGSEHSEEGVWTSGLALSDF